MSFIDAPTNFYIGRTYKPDTDEILKDEAVYYDSRDLTTHGLVLGMTGSGKTGLCIGILEEAILDGIPAIIVDPKGDIGNLLLTFPDFNPKDFEPWIDEDEARRKGNDVPTHAAGKADLWKNGLTDWGITPERMERLKSAAEYAIFTPKQLAALPVTGARVVWSRGSYDPLAIGAAVPAVTAIDTVDFHLNEALTNLYVGLHRELRGEHLAAMRFIQVYAVDRVLALVRLDRAIEAERTPEEIHIVVKK